MACLHYSPSQDLKIKLEAIILLHVNDSDPNYFIYIQNSIRNVSVATDEGASPKLALSEGGSRGNIES